MKRIKFVTRRRGFFSHLENNEQTEVEFLFLENIFEVPSLKRTIASKLIRSKLISYFGVIQRINYNKKEDSDVLLGSFNRFLRTDNEYIIYLENPTALYHYTLNRNKTYLGRKNFEEYLSDNHLKKIICMSKACEETISENFYPSINLVDTIVIYPLVRNNDLVSLKSLENKKNTKKLKVLFIAQGSRFISKGSIEVIEAMNRLKDKSVQCTIITNINSLDNSKKTEIKEMSNIELLDFDFNYDQMESIYAEHDVLIHPSSDDSFGLTVLEAMKAGLPIIGSNLYAFPEMITEDKNGYMVDPKWSFFDKKNIPNPDVWENRKETLFSENVSEKIVLFLMEKILYMLENPEKLSEMSIESYKKAMSPPFSEEFILSQWLEVYNEIKN